VRARARLCTCGYVPVAYALPHHLIVLAHPKLVGMQSWGGVASMGTPSESSVMMRVSSLRRCVSGEMVHDGALTAGNED